MKSGTIIVILTVIIILLLLLIINSKWKDYGQKMLEREQQNNLTNLMLGAEQGTQATINSIFFKIENAGVVILKRNSDGKVFNLVENTTCRK